METLEQVLDSIEFKDGNEFNESQLKQKIEQAMPGWNIEVWDMDDYGNELTSSVADTIISEVSAGNTDIQYGEWNTWTMDAYFAVLATRKKQDIRELLHNVFNLTIHEAKMHGDKKWTVKELDDTENSIVEYVLSKDKQPKTKD